MCFRMRISQNSHAMRKFCEISHSHRIAEPISDSHNFRKMRTKFSHAKNSHYAKLSQNANFRKMRIYAKCEFKRSANFREMRIYAKCELSLSIFRQMRILKPLFLKFLTLYIYVLLTLARRKRLMSENRSDHSVAPTWSRVFETNT